MSDQQQASLPPPPKNTSSIILTANGFQKWDGHEWQQIDCDVPDSAENNYASGFSSKMLELAGIPNSSGDNLYTEFVNDIQAFSTIPSETANTFSALVDSQGGIAARMLELVGIPKSYSDNLYAEFAQDVQVFSAIPTQTANTFYGFVNWLRGRNSISDAPASTEAVDDSTGVPLLNSRSEIPFHEELPPPVEFQDPRASLANELVDESSKVEMKSRELLVNERLEVPLYEYFPAPPIEFQDAPPTVANINLVGECESPELFETTPEELLLLNERLGIHLNEELPPPVEFQDTPASLVIPSQTESCNNGSNDDENKLEAESDTIAEAISVVDDNTSCLDNTPDAPRKDFLHAEPGEPNTYEPDEPSKMTDEHDEPKKTADESDEPSKTTLVSFYLPSDDGESGVSSMSQKQYRTTVFIPSSGPPPRHNSYRDMFREKTIHTQQQPRKPAHHKATIYVDLSSKSVRMFDEGTFR